ncbi:MAG: NAD-dependent epimerase/dehydratase family protein, partial [Cytophagaceae bacterium]
MKTDAPILVTGAAGFIGFHVSKALIAQGRRVVGFDNINDYYDTKLKFSRLDILKDMPGFTFIKGDLSDPKAINELFDQHRPDYVVNLAAQAGVRPVHQGHRHQGADGAGGPRRPAREGAGRGRAHRVGPVVHLRPGGAPARRLPIQHRLPAALARGAAHRGVAAEGGRAPQGRGAAGDRRGAGLQQGRVPVEEVPEDLGRLLERARLSRQALPAQLVALRLRVGLAGRRRGAGQAVPGRLRPGAAQDRRDQAAC